MTVDLTRLSKTMAYALRYHPDDFGLTLDQEGWVSTDDLLAALRGRRSEWRHLQLSDLQAVLAQSEKKRYEIQNGKIRAYYGHSVAQKVEREPSVPPSVLYHGTTPQAYKKIQKEGLKPMGRQYVHLSEDQETARQVALRRTDRPVILQVMTRDASDASIHFYLGNDKVWLADPMLPAFIQVI